MITYEDALQIVLDNSYPTGSGTVDLLESTGRILAEEVFSDIDMPPYNRAAVDGFACRKEDLGQPLEIIETVRAGMFPSKRVSNGQCTQIMTGAAVPEGANCVIMVEESEAISDDLVRFNGTLTKTNISPRAEDVKKGDKVLDSGILLKPQHIAIMAAVGHIKVKVASMPRVAVMATGDEIVEPEVKPDLSQIRNSNGYQLTAQIRKSGALAEYLGIIPDDENATLKGIEEALARFDIVLLTGGISMGAYDFVPAIMEKAGVEILFRTVALQPGKPTIFGVKDEKRIFGLPGNPVSAFTIFEILVKPLIFKMVGMKDPVTGLKLPMGVEFSRRRTDRMQWIPASIRDGRIFPLEYHGSAHIFSLGLANAIAAIPLGRNRIKEGELIDARPV